MVAGSCQKCGVVRERLHRDHVVPKHLGGASHKSNYQYLCANCHEDKTREEMKVFYNTPAQRAARAERARRPKEDTTKLAHRNATREWWTTATPAQKEERAAQMRRGWSSRREAA